MNKQRASRQVKFFVQFVAPALLLPGCAAGVVGVAALLGSSGGGGGGGNAAPIQPAVASVDRNFAATSGTEDGQPSVLTLRVVNIPQEFAVAVDGVEACVSAVDRSRGTVTLEVPDHRFLFPAGECVIDPTKNIRLPNGLRETTSRPGVVQVTVTDLKSGQQSSSIPFFYNPPIGPAEPTQFEDPQSRLIAKGGIQVPLEGQYFTFLDTVCQNGYPNPTVEGTQAFIQRVDGSTTISREIAIEKVENDNRLVLNVDKASIDVLLQTKAQPTSAFRLRVETPNGPAVQVPVFLGLPYPVEKPNYISRNGQLVLRWVDNCDGPPLRVEDVPFDQIDPDAVGTPANDTPFNERFPEDPAGNENYINGFRITRRKGGSSEQLLIEKNFQAKSGAVFQEYTTDVPATDGIYSYTIVGQIGGDVRTAPVEVLVPVIQFESAYDLIWDRTPRLEVCNDETDNDGDTLVDARDPECNQDSEAGRLAASLLRLGRRSLVFNKPTGLADLLDLFTDSQRSRIVSLWILHGESVMTKDSVTGMQTLDNFRGNIPFFTEEDVTFLLDDPPDRVWISAGNLWSSAYDTDPTIRQRSVPTRLLLERFAGRTAPPSEANLLLDLSATSGPVEIPETPKLNGDFILLYRGRADRPLCGGLNTFPPPEPPKPFETLALRDDLSPISPLPDPQETELYASVRDICLDDIDNDEDGAIDEADGDECPRIATASILSVIPGLTSLSSSFTTLSFGESLLADVVNEVRCQLALEVCNNQVDDNADGLIDALDPTCRIPLENCRNGLDDDFDGRVDCADPECKDIALEGGQDFTTCFNGIDDDCDGFTDCQDSECKGILQEDFSAENCDDGRDNDCDGAVDLQDSGCSFDF